MGSLPCPGNSHDQNKFTMAQIVKADLDEMVFEDRERGYGAYFLRKNYARHLTVGMILISIAAVLFTFGPIVYNQLGLGVDEDAEEMMRIAMTMEDLPPPPPLEEDVPPPPPPPDLPPPEVKQVSFKIPEPTPADELPEEEATITEIKELEEAKNIGLDDVEGVDEAAFFDGVEDGGGDVPQVIVEQVPDINAFIFAEEEPVPVNMEEIKKMIGYPQLARDAGIEGQVVIRVLVDKNGNYARHRIINQVHPILAKACEEQLHKLKFTPAIQGGKPIQFWVNIPFNFKLMN